MIPKVFRLKKRTAFLATYRTGKSYHYKGITLFCGREKATEVTTKVGFVVSKKTHKRAVKRNRLKRLMRESLRLYIKGCNETLDSRYMSLIFVASSKVLDKDFKDIDTYIRKLVELSKNA